MCARGKGGLTMGSMWGRDHGVMTTEKEQKSHGEMEGVEGKAAGKGKDATKKGKKVRWRNERRAASCCSRRGPLIQQTSSEGEVFLPPPPSHHT